MDGGLYLTYEDRFEKYVEKGWFFFIPSGANVGYVIANKCQAIVFRLQYIDYLCNGFRMEQLFDGNHNDLPHLNIYPLEINHTLWYCLNGLDEAIGSGLNCRDYHEVKIKEVNTLIRSFYSKMQLRYFFSPILSSNMQFSEFIRRNHHKFKTVGEMADFMHMSPKNFTKKFNLVFGMPPSLWKNRERAQRIFNELSIGNKSFGQISEEYGFKVQAHLNKFCKREFGKNPGEIRKGVNKCEQSVTKI